jgi:hypothetical protein
MASSVIAVDSPALTLADSVGFPRTNNTGEQVYEYVNSVPGDGDRLIAVESAGTTDRDRLTRVGDLLRAGR